MGRCEGAMEGDDDKEVVVCRIGDEDGCLEGSIVGDPEGIYDCAVDGSESVESNRVVVLLHTR